MLKQFSIPTYIILASILNVACSGDDPKDTGGDNKTTTETGVLFDGPVSGVNYQTATQTGETDSQGIYAYLPGETVTFSIGDINFPPTDAAPIVTPLDIVGSTDLTNTSVINMVRLLQSLDVDGDPTNGIKISPDAHTAAMGLTIAFNSPTFDADVANLIANSGSVVTALIDGNTAITNFKQSLSTQTIDWESYNYLANNRQWNYTLTQGGPLPGTLYEYTINGVANGQNVFIHGWSPNWSDYLEYFLQDLSNGLFVVGFQDSGTDIFFTAPVMLGCNNLYETCTVAGSDGGIDYSMSLFNELEIVNVSAGSFSDCIKTTQTDNIGNQNRVRWFCKGAGQVRHEKVGEFTYELDSISTYTP